MPSFFFILLGAPFVQPTRGDLKFTAPLTAITPAVAGVIVNLALFFAQHVRWPRVLGGPALEVRAAPLVRSLQSSGRVATASHVAQVLVQEGARVRRGDVLVQLDADELHAALAQVDERYLDQLVPGQTAAVVADAQAVLEALKAPADSAAATFTNTMGR